VRNHALTIPIQALTVRQQTDLQAENDGKGSVQAAAPQNEASKAKDRDKEEIQGVFIIRTGKQEFMPVETGITGTTDIEVLNGLKEGDEIVTGSYKVLRHDAPGNWRQSR